MKVAIRPFGEHTILIDWPTVIGEEAQLEIRAVHDAIQKVFPHLVIETVTTYRCLAVYLKESASLKDCLSRLKAFIDTIAVKTESKKRVVTIPVCYEDSFALDMKKVAKKSQLSIASVILLHTATLYPVIFLGFLPGFPYLAGLNKKLHSPRLKSPRLQIPAGSVGIGGSQTGIYPSNSPGGWNIIGRTPLELFNVTKNPPNLLKAGDYVKLSSISLTEYNAMTQSIIAGTFHLKTESL